MILKPKPIDQKSDDELEKDLKKVTNLDAWLFRNSKSINGGIAVTLAAIAYYNATTLVPAGMAMPGLTGAGLVLAGTVGSAAILAVGLVVGAIGITRIKNGLTNMWRSTASSIRKEQADREYKKTPAYARAMQWAKAEAVRAKDELKKAFNNAVEKAFHTGTENKVTVKKPLTFKKPAEPKKKKFLGMKF